MGRSQRHMVEEQGSAATGSAVNQGVVAPGLLLQATDAPASADPLEVLRGIENVTVPHGPAGGPLAGSSLTGPIPSGLDAGGGGGTDPLPPGIMSLSPQFMVEGTASVDVTIYGSNFVDGCVAMLGAVSLPTVFNSPTNLTATVAFPEYNPSIYMISVTNPDGQVSAAKMFYITAAKPVLDTIDPTECDVGAAPFTIAAVGSNFVDGSQIFIAGGARATTFVDANNLTAQFDLASLPAGPHEVLIGNPNGDDSNALVFTINAAAAAAPTTTALMPVSAVVDAASFALNIAGTGFANGAVVSFSGAPLATTFIDANNLTAQCDITGKVAGDYGVVVINPDSQVSNPQTFTITAAAAGPTLTSISPTTAVVGDPPVAMTVTGTGFDAASKVQFWGADVPTVFVSATSLTATVTLDGFGASDYPVSVINGAVSSNAILFPLTDPVARSKAKAPAKAPAKAAAKAKPGKRK